jgi:hypothetical protein
LNHKLPEITISSGEAGGGYFEIVASKWRLVAETETFGFVVRSDCPLPPPDEYNVNSSVYLDVLESCDSPYVERRGNAVF